MDFSPPSKLQCFLQTFAVIYLIIAFTNFSVFVLTCRVRKKMNVLNQWKYSDSLVKVRHNLCKRNEKKEQNVFTQCNDELRHLCALCYRLMDLYVYGTCGNLQVYIMFSERKASIGHLDTQHIIQVTVQFESVLFCTYLLTYLTLYMHHAWWWKSE